MNTATKTEEKPETATVRRTAYVTPQANIFETKDGYVLEAEMPGVNKEGLEITIENNELSIVGRRSDAAPAGTPVYRELRDFNYRRLFDLDPSIDAAKITAKIEHGILRLALPKAESVKPRKITVTE